MQNFFRINVCSKRFRGTCQRTYCHIHSFQNVVLRVPRRENSWKAQQGLFIWCFWQNLYWSDLVPQISPTLLVLKTFCCGPALKQYSFCKTFHLKCLRVFWICLCLVNYSAIWTVTGCYVLHQTHPEFWNIQSYSALLMHIHPYRDTIKAYLGLFRHIQHPVWPSHIHKHAIFWHCIFRTKGLFKTLWNVDRAFQNPAIGHDFGISEPCAMLAFTETWHNWNLRIFKTLS